MAETKKVYYDKSCNIEEKISEEEKAGWQMISQEPMQRIKSEFQGIKIGYERKEES